MNHDKTKKQVKSDVQSGTNTVKVNDVQNPQKKSDVQSKNSPDGNY